MSLRLPTKVTRSSIQASVIQPKTWRMGRMQFYTHRKQNRKLFSACGEFLVQAEYNTPSSFHVLRKRN